MIIQTSTYPVEAYGRRGMDRGYLRFNPRITIVKWYDDQENSDPTVGSRIRKSALSLYRPCAELRLLMLWISDDPRSVAARPSSTARATKQAASAYRLSKEREALEGYSNFESATCDM